MDEEFLKTIEAWRIDLTRNLALRNPITSFVRTWIDAEQGQSGRPRKEVAERSHKLRSTQPPNTK